MAFNRPLPIANPRNVLVLSLDFDGCLANEAYIEKYDEILQKLREKLWAVLTAKRDATLTDSMRQGLESVLKRAHAKIIDHMIFQSRLFPAQMIKAVELSVETFLSDEEYHKKDLGPFETLKMLATSIVSDAVPQIEENMQNFVKSLNKALFDANPLLVAHVKKTVRENSIDLIAGVIGSARQSQNINRLNSRHGSCMVVTEGFITLLEAEVNVPCVMNRALLSDGYGNLPAGSNFNYIAYGAFELCTPWFFDSKKISIYYTQTHQMSTLFRGANIWFHGVDDKLEYLQSQMFFFFGGANLPKKLTLSLYEYDGKNFQIATNYALNAGKNSYPAQIQGKGICDNHYNTNVRKMVELSHYIWASPDSAREESAISLYGENKLKYQNGKILDVDNLLEEIKLVFEEWKGQVSHYYTDEQIAAFHEAFDDLYTSLQLNVMGLKKLGYTEEEMQISPAGVTARECLGLLRVAMQQRFYEASYQYGFYDQSRKQQLLNFASSCGQRTPFIYALTLAFIQKTSLITLYRLCVQTPVLSHGESVLRYLLTSWPILKPAEWIGRYGNQMLFSTTYLAPKVAAVGECVNALVQADDKAWQENRASLKH